MVSASRASALTFCTMISPSGARPVVVVGVAGRGGSAAMLGSSSRIAVVR